ncbi:MAG: stalk domain-containing protein [archaeon]|nr:stalk domain-containing protein [Candidatus Jingweiarchaeum tengchongense]
MKRNLVIFPLILLLLLFNDYVIRKTNFVNSELKADYCADCVKITLFVGRASFTQNNLEKFLDVPVFIKNGRAFVQLRPIVESLGGTVDWYGETKGVKIIFNSSTIELWIGNQNAKVNGNTIQIEPENPRIIPELYLGKTIVPVRFLSNYLGLNLEWYSEEKRIDITYNPNLILLNVGGTYTVSLDENPSAGFKWHCQIGNNSVIEIVNETFISPAQQIPGSPGKHLWTIRGNKSGETSIIFEYYRDWEPNKIEKTITYQIIIH